MQFVQLVLKFSENVCCHTAVYQQPKYVLSIFAGIRTGGRGDLSDCRHAEEMVETKIVERIYGISGIFSLDGDSGEHR